MASERSDVGVLGEIVHRIVEVARPERIILFGSAARGQMGGDSDVDLLVVVEPGVHRRRLTIHLPSAERCGVSGGCGSGNVRGRGAIRHVSGPDH